MVGHWKWAANKLHATWSIPIRSSRCLTVYPVVQCWQVTVKALSSSSRDDLPEIACSSRWESVCDDYLVREEPLYMGINSIQLWAERSSSAKVLPGVWSTLAELAHDKEHLGGILSAMAYAWGCHESPESRLEDALTLWRKILVMQRCPVGLWSPLQVAEVGAMRSQLESMYLSGGSVVVEAFQHVSTSPNLLARSPSSSFERLASPSMFNNNIEQDWAFDLDDLSPSGPFDWQRNLSGVSPLRALRQATQRSNWSQDDEEWNQRMLDRFPPSLVRRSSRIRIRPERLQFSVSHSSMDTDISSSVSPTTYRTASGIDGIRRIGARGECMLPESMRLPCQAEIDRTFVNRTTQSRLAWPIQAMTRPLGSKTKAISLAKSSLSATPAGDELHCLLCDCVMPSSQCEHDPTKFKGFCGHCWTSSKSVCKELLGLSSSQERQESAARSPKLSSAAQANVSSDDSGGCFCKLIMVDASSMSTVLLEVGSTGSLSVPTIATKAWHQSTGRLITELGLKCKRIVKLARLEEDRSANDLVWIIAVVDGHPSQAYAEHWSWEYCAVGDSLYNDAQKLPDADIKRIQYTLQYLEEYDVE